ncbi:cation diffusion facilitator family transporter [Leptolyngbyaceae cyanobacterium UHCC 1019]
MHIHNLEQWQHTHDFSANQEAAEKSTQKVMLLTAFTMVVEIVTGTLFGSMALLADGWHMATHTAAFGIAIFAYRYARRYSSNPKYTFGTGKVSALGGFASATALAVVALVMALESISRFFQPQVIQFNEAIGVAIFGLVINLISGFLLQEHHIILMVTVTITIRITICGRLTFMFWQMRSPLFLPSLRCLPENSLLGIG